MDRLGRERGLIAYATLADYSTNMALATAGGTAQIDPARVRGADGAFEPRIRHFDWRVVLRPRVLVYAGAWCLAGLALVFALLSRDRLDLNVIHDRNPQYVLESDGSVRNGYEIKLLNMIPEPRVITLSIEGLPGATLKAAGRDSPDGRTLAIDVEPDRVTPVKLFVTLPGARLAEAEGGFRLVAEDRQGHERDVYSANFNVPGER